MAESDQTAVATPKTESTRKSSTGKPKPRRQPPYNVILHNDEDHTYEYVVQMLGKLFGHSETKAFRMAQEVDTTERVIVDTTTLERAELKRDQIHAYGKDHRMERCAGSMRASIEPATDE